MSTTVKDPRPRAADAPKREVLLPVRLYIHPEDEQWVAVADAYTIVGTGSTAEEAASRAMELLFSYLSSSHRDGISLEDARRPIPRLWHLKLKLKMLVSRAMHTVNRASDAGRIKRVPLPDQFDGCLPA
jgi:predicted RNase H-like HicB family nuclease